MQEDLLILIKESYASPEHKTKLISYLVDLESKVAVLEEEKTRLIEDIYWVKQENNDD